MENTAPVNKTKETRFDNIAPLNKPKTATLENIAPVDESGKAILENIAPLEKSIEIGSAKPAKKSPLTVLIFVRKQCTPLNDLSTSQSTVISSAETSKSLLSVLSSDLRTFPTKSLHCFERAFEVSIDCAQF